MSLKRTQLTLFIPEASAIEAIRRQYNPVQQALIAAHVTVCREDELVNLEQVLHNLSQLDFPAFTIRFGKPVRFHEGKGVLLPSLEDYSPFRELRKAVLKDINEAPRNHEPHITMMHPRNAECTDNIFEEICKVKLPGEILFTKISLIEQVEGSEWNIIKNYNLHEASTSC